MYDINLNSAECLIKKMHLTYTDVVNVCADTSVHVPHAISDYLLLVVLGLSIGMAVAIFGLIISDY